MHDVLIIDSYAGSLTIAASNLGFDIRGSYEEDGYGLPIQQLNFPNLKYKERIQWWPTTNDLSNTIVLAHPPCAAFSQQNNSASAKGTDAKKFQSTIRVIQYALKNQCAALALESVIPALEGAREVHDSIAKEWDYDVYRIIQNAVSFGVPQWRPRFWVIFIRREQIENFKVSFMPTYKSVGQVMTEADPGPVDQGLHTAFLNQMILLKSNGFTDTEIDTLMIHPELYGSLPGLIKKHLAGTTGSRISLMDSGAIAKELCVWGNFMSHCLRVLDPAGFATTLLFDSWWCCMGQVLSYAEYKAVMGFPRDYAFPTKLLPKFREYLSRGVCPPVAEWVLMHINNNLTGSYIFQPGSALHVLQPGAVLDLLPVKGEVKLG